MTMIFKRIVLWCVVPVVLGCASTQLTLEGDHLVIPFRVIGAGIPVVRATLNDKEAWFIIDTGASVTLVNMSRARYFGFYTEHHAGEREISGLGGTVSFGASTCKIGIGPLVIRHRVLRSPDLDRLFSAICESEQLSIAGILGGDILMQYRINIDYDTRTISCRITNEMRKLLVAR